MLFRWLLLPLLATLCSACGMFGGPMGPASPAQPPEYVPPGGQSKCKVSGSQTRPLIVEWPAADRAALEVLALRGTVVVRYSGCEMEVLPRCRAPGAYHYVPTTRKTERVVIQDEDELYANLPIGAAKLEGKLRRAGQLDVNMNVVGQFDLDQGELPSDALEGDCRKATHFVTGLTVGAFEFAAGGNAEAGGEASGLGAGVGGTSARRREVISSDGEVAACERSAREDKEPPTGCGALLRVALAELASAAPVAAPKVDCPEGTTSVGGRCLEQGGLGTSEPAVASQAARLHVRVTCGLSYQYAMLGESDGLKVWVDGELTPAFEEVRAYNAMAPGAPGMLQFVAYEVEPGEHRVRIASDECEAAEHVVKVNPGAVRDVQGRLRPTAWYRQPPAGSAGIGIAASYMWMKPAHVTAENDAYDDVQLTPEWMSGPGFEFPFSLPNVWMSLAFSWTRGTLPIVAPACKYDSGGDCLPAGTKVEGTVKGYHAPILAAGRLPFVHGAALLGSGIEFNIFSLDLAEAESNFSYSSSGLGLHAPVWAGLEVRPICSLSLTARAAHGFSLLSDVGSYNSATVSLALYASDGCGDSDFGIQ